MFLLQEQPQTVTPEMQVTPVPEEQGVMEVMEATATLMHRPPHPPAVEQVGPQALLAQRVIRVTPVIPDAPLQCFVYHLALAVLAVLAALAAA